MVKRICLAMATSTVLATQSLGLNLSTTQANQNWSKYAGGNHILFVSGREGGGYHTIGSNAVKILKTYAKSYATGKSINIDVATTDGSAQNLSLILEQNKANIGLTQVDVLLNFLDKNPQYAKNIAIYPLEKYKERLMCIVKKDDGIDEGDWQDEDNIVKIGINSYASGTAKTLEIMNKLEPKFKNSKMIETGNYENGIQDLKSGYIDTYCMMTGADASSKLFKSVDKDKALTFMTITDWDLDDNMVLNVNGKDEKISNYKRVKVDINTGFFKDKIKTIETEVAIIVLRKKDENTRIINRAIETILQNNK